MKWAFKKSIEFISQWFLVWNINLQFQILCRWCTLPLIALVCSQVTLIVIHLSSWYLNQYVLVPVCLGLGNRTTWFGVGKDDTTTVYLCLLKSTLNLGSHRTWTQAAWTLHNKLAFIVYLYADCNKWAEVGNLKLHIIHNSSIPHVHPSIKQKLKNKAKQDLSLNPVNSFVQMHPHISWILLV